MIDKVGAMVVRGGKVLVVQKKTKDDRKEYIILGGKREGDETDREVLERELMEEIGVELISMEPLGGYDDIAVFENIPIHIEAYLVEMEGEPRCDSEIKALAWIDRDYEKQGIEVGSILGKHVIPKLIEIGKM